MIDAWFSSSERIRVPGPPSALSTPRLAAKPVGKQTAASVPFHAASACSSSVVHRTRSGDEPGATGPGAPPVERGVGRGDDRRVAAQAEVVVGRERDDRPASPVIGASAPSGPRASKLRGARQRPSARIRASCSAIRSAQLALTGRSRHRRRGGRRRSRHGAVAGGVRRGDVVEGRLDDVDDAVDLAGGDRQRRHEHNDVAERPQEHAAGDRGGRDAAAPAEAAGRRRQLDADHEARWRTSATAGWGATCSASRAASWADRRSTLASTSHSLEQLQVPSATAAARAFPP